jgi:hypothetical protein
MKTFKQQVTIPSAWVVRSKDKGRLSIKNGNVYMSDGEEFMIELFNPTMNTVLANIKLDGKPISKSGIVVYPGQRVYLDHFPDTGKLFTFTTYEVDDEKELHDAVYNNGKVDVTFHNEEVTRIENWTTRWVDVYIPRRVYPYNPYIPYRETETVPYSPQPIWYGTTSNSNIGNLSSTYTTGETFNSKSTFETGVVTGGGKTKQVLTDVDMNFERTVVSQVSVRIMPESQRPYEAIPSKKTKKVTEDRSIDSLVKLAGLYEKGHLSKEEFEDAKRRVLDQL